MRAIFRIFGNESQPGLQLVEKLERRILASSSVLYTFFQVSGCMADLHRDKFLLFLKCKVKGSLSSNRFENSGN